MLASSFAPFAVLDQQWSDWSQTSSKRMAKIHGFTHLHLPLNQPQQLGKSTRLCPSSLAKLVQIIPITMVYGRYIYTIPMVYKPTVTSLGGHHLAEILRQVSMISELCRGVRFRSITTLPGAPTPMACSWSDAVPECQAGSSWENPYGVVCPG